MTDEVETTTPAEAPVEAPATESLSDKLPRREAIQKAIELDRAGGTEKPAAAAAPDPAPSTAQVKAAVEIDVEPPAEFSAAGKDAWLRKDVVAIQREFRRLHDSRTQEVTRAQAEARRAAEESKTYKELAKTIAPYIEARGADGTTPEKALMEAVALVQELKKNPKAAKAELERLGFDFSGDGAIREDDPKIVALQKQVEALQQKEQTRTFENVHSQFSASFSKLGAEKTRTGEPVFPDLFDASEAGKQLASEIGSLASDPRFIQGVLRRIPGADHADICREAYKFLGGRVSESKTTADASVSQNTQDIQRKRRAAASTPGSVAPSRNGDALKGKLSRRAAIQRALEEQREH